MPRPIDQFWRIRSQKKRKDVDYIVQYICMLYPGRFILIESVHILGVISTVSVINLIFVADHQISNGCRFKAVKIKVLNLIYNHLDNKVWVLKPFGKRWASFSPDYIFALDSAMIVVISSMMIVVMVGSLLYQSLPTTKQIITYDDWLLIVVPDLYSYLMKI